MINKLFVGVVIFVVLFGCNEEFNPVAEFKEKYSLNCILRPDDSVQVVVITKNYKKEEIDEKQSIKSFSVNNAFIRIWYKDKVAIFKQNTGEVLQSNVPEGAYYHKGMEIIQGEKYEVEAVLPNGKKLKSTLSIPINVSSNYKSTSDKIPATNNSPDSINFSWKINHSSLLSLPKFKLYYVKKDNNGTKTANYIEVPFQYINVNGIDVPYYPQPSYSQLARIHIKNVENKFNDIEPVYNLRNKIKVVGIVCQIRVFDSNLSRYYASTNQFKETASLIIDEPDFSSIDGGFGIFGTFINKNFSVLFDNNYIKNFGFNDEEFF